MYIYIYILYSYILPNAYCTGCAHASPSRHLCWQAEAAVIWPVTQTCRHSYVLCTCTLVYHMWTVI